MNWNMINRQKAAGMLFVAALFVLMGADGEGTCSGEIEGEPPGEEIEELLDILRTADAPMCQREGEGWPLGECPSTCIAATSPSTVLDLEKGCRLTEEHLGGPAFCAPSSEANRDCTSSDVCWNDEQNERVGIYGGSGCHKRPEGWQFCPEPILLEDYYDPCQTEM